MALPRVVAPWDGYAVERAELGELHAGVGVPLPVHAAQAVREVDDGDRGVEGRVECAHLLERHGAVAVRVRGAEPHGEHRERRAARGDRVSLRVERAEERGRRRARDAARRADVKAVEEPRREIGIRAPDHRRDQRRDVRGRQEAVAVRVSGVDPAVHRRPDALPVREGRLHPPMG